MENDAQRRGGMELLAVRAANHVEARGELHHLRGGAQPARHTIPNW